MKKILSLTITGSDFYSDLNINFSEKLNCIMGGRGTGKTTLLYFIKAALENEAENNKNVYSILKDNLNEGKIIVKYQASNGQVFEIHKTFNDLPQISLNGNHISSEKFNNEIVCDFYEAQAIEEIGRNGYSRLQLLDKKIIEDVSDLLDDIQTLQIEAKVNAQDIKSINIRIKQKKDGIASIESVEDQFANHKKEKPTDISDANNQAFEDADKKEKSRNAETRYINRLLAQSLDAQKSIDKFIEDTHEFLTKSVSPVIAGSINSPNKLEVLELAKGVHSAIINAIRYQEQANLEVKKGLNLINDISQSIFAKHEVQQAEFVKFKQSFETSKEYINKYNLLSKKVEEYKNLKLETEELVLKRNKLKESRTGIISTFNLKKQELFNKRLKCAKEINANFDQSILINLSYGGLKDEFEEALRQALKGSGLRYNELIPRIVSNFSPDQFAQVINESNLDSLKSISGIDTARSEALINSLKETDFIYGIETIYTPDLPDFLLRIRKSTEAKTTNYKKSDLLSMGQRCTAVLPVIFAVSDNPLIIDQPEDNLDNKYITESIHEIIRNQKDKRQLIFITHNPNIPVLSESEQNVFLTYDLKSEIEKQGTVNNVKDEIINLLEGGEKAFKQRKDTYGY